MIKMTVLWKIGIVLFGFIVGLGSIALAVIYKEAITQWFELFR